MSVEVSRELVEVNRESVEVSRELEVKREPVEVQRVSATFISATYSTYAQPERKKMLTLDDPPHIKI